MAKEDKSINPASLPENEQFRKTEVNQYPQPADWGKPMRDEEKLDPALKGKQADRSSDEQGLNEEKSSGTGGAYEGLEDLQG